jgi:hypothetical protein
MRESVNVTVLRSNDWLCFVFMHFIFFFIRFLCTLFVCFYWLLGKWWVSACALTYLLLFFFFLLNFFLHSNQIYCDLCECCTVVFVFVSIYFIFI